MTRTKIKGSKSVAGIKRLKTISQKKKQALWINLHILHHQTRWTKSELLYPPQRDTPSSRWFFHYVHKDIFGAKSMFAPLVGGLTDVHSRVLKTPSCRKQGDLEWELSKCFIYSNQLGRVRWLSGRRHRIRRFKSNNMDSIRSRHCKTYNPLVIKNTTHREDSALPLTCWNEKWLSGQRSTQPSMLLLWRFLNTKHYKKMNQLWLANNSYKYFCNEKCFKIHFSVVSLQNYTMFC